MLIYVNSFFSSVFLSCKVSSNIFINTSILPKNKKEYISGLILLKRLLDLLYISSINFIVGLIKSL